MVEGLVAQWGGVAAAEPPFKISSTAKSCVYFYCWAI